MARSGLRLGVLSVVVAVSVSCDRLLPPPDQATIEAGVEAWEAKRLSALDQPDGWLSLVALHWLDEGSNPFGSSVEEGLRYEGAATPGVVGSFEVRGDSVWFESAEGVDIVLGDEPAKTTLMRPVDDELAVLRLGELRWHVMRRDGKAVVRLKDGLSPLVTEFEGIERFELDTEWYIPARMVFHDPPDTIQVPNILGGESSRASPVTVVFDYDGQRYELDMWKDSDDPENFFTAFADRTNGDETYGAGRFIWVDAPDPNGHTFIDFNRAYNPPCVFTPYATCPLPPRQNRMDIRVEAGEMNFKSDYF
jgi:uncharacterized protein (DUF1684 family)